MLHNYHLRIDKNILEKIKSFAKEDGRLLNKEIEHILKLYIQQGDK